MERRHFLGTALAAAGATAAGGPAGAAQTGGSRAGPGSDVPELYELRRYRLRIGPQPQRLRDYLERAALPAWGRLGLGPIGVFEPAGGVEAPSLYVLLTHPTPASAVGVAAGLAADAEYQRAATSYLALPASDPPFHGLESELLAAFDSMPRIEVPAAAARGEPRIFELRTYLSPSEAAHRKKMEMFTPRLGELEIFRRTGLAPVFFGRALASWRLPSFTYMLAFADEAARRAAWSAFVADPAWKALSATPGYTDPEIMSSITSVILRPLPFSQV